jgi:hypothetical protein
MTKLCIIVVITALPSLVYASSVAVIRTPSAIYAAADSFSYNTSGQSASDLCKIIQVGNVFFATSGLEEFTFTNSAFNFSPWEIARAAARFPGTMADKGARFTQLAYAPFLRSVRLIKLYNPTAYQTGILGRNALAAIFFGLNPGNIPAYDTERFRVDDFGQGPVITLSKLTCPGKDCTISDDNIGMIGLNDLALKEAAKPGFLTKTDWAKDVEHLVEVEAAAYPNVVKPPIDVIRISASGAHWIHHKKECPAIQ